MAIADAYLHTPLTEDNEEVWMTLDGFLAELMVKVAPNLYSKYVTVGSKGRPMSYVKVHKAIYGILQSALLFYRKLSEPT